MLIKCLPAIVLSAQKKGVLHHRVLAEQFSLIEGEALLTLYQFDTKEAQHYCCNTCRIHPFSKPRSAPNMYSINVRCLDDFDLESESYQTINFDGRNWEQAVTVLVKSYRTLFLENFHS